MYENPGEATAPLPPAADTHVLTAVVLLGLVADLDCFGTPPHLALLELCSTLFRMLFLTKPQSFDANRTHDVNMRVRYANLYKIYYKRTIYNEKYEGRGLPRDVKFTWEYPTASQDYFWCRNGICQHEKVTLVEKKIPFYHHQIYVF